MIDIAWDTAVPTPNNPSTASRHQKFLQIIDDYLFFQHVKAFTRPISGKVLDLLLSTYPNAISDTSNVSGLSDHLAVIFEVNLKPTRSVKPPFLCPINVCLSNLIFMELEVKCLVGLKLSCLITHRMFQSMEFSPHLESSRVLF